MTTGKLRKASRHDDRRAVGQAGEELAKEYLVARGAVVLDTNWRCRHGEIDLVVADQGELVIVEVKSRRSARYGRAVWAVTEEKYLRLRRLAGAWMAEHDISAVRVRIDVIGIEWCGGQFRIDHRRAVQP